MNSDFDVLGMTLSAAIIVTFLPVVIALIGSSRLNRHSSTGLVLISLGLGYAFGLVEEAAILAVCLMAVAFYRFSAIANSRYNWVLGIVVLLSCAAMLIHAIPGFNNPVVIQSFKISELAPDYTQYLNLDKAILAVLLLVFVVPKSQAVVTADRIHAISTFTVFAIIATIVALMTNLVALDPKVTPILISWMLINLLFTCFAEEAVFRGFIQVQIKKAIGSKPYAGWASVVVTGVVFGVAHIAGGGKYVAVACIIGIGYSYVYHKTQNIYAAIWAHFLFNLSHILILTYPYLKVPN